MRTKSARPSKPLPRRVMIGSKSNPDYAVSGFLDGAPQYTRNIQAALLFPINEAEKYCELFPSLTILS